MSFDSTDRERAYREGHQDFLRVRTARAQQIADRLGVSIDRVFAEWRKSEEECKKWLKMLAESGYKPGDCPLEYLKRTNPQKEP
jgi:hypothetical protein